MEPTILQTVVMALAAGTVSLTLTNATIFEWLRDWIKTKSDFLGDLFECPYCMSHWTALLVMFVYQPRILSTGNMWPDLVVSWFALTALSSVVAGLILRALSGSED